LRLLRMREIPGPSRSSRDRGIPGVGRREVVESRLFENEPVQREGLLWVAGTHHRLREVDRDCVRIAGEPRLAVATPAPRNNPRTCALVCDLALDRALAGLASDNESEGFARRWFSDASLPGDKHRACRACLASGEGATHYSARMREESSALVRIRTARGALRPQGLTPLPWIGPRSGPQDAEPETTAINGQQTAKVIASRQKAGWPRQPPAKPARRPSPRGPPRAVRGHEYPQAKLDHETRAST